MNFVHSLRHLVLFSILAATPLILPAQSGFQGFTLPGNTSTKKSWNLFKTDFVSPDGRVIDDMNGGISHSEGQGYGMILAASNRDLATFSLIWQWTKDNLQVRDDGLFAWKWDPSRPSDPITDRNNATDGDLLIAWALQRGGELWRNERLVEESREILRIIRQKMVVESPIGPVLLPGADGFQRPEGVVVNPSYWVFPALLDARRIDPSYIWDALYVSGVRLLKEARFGKWDLAPDWVLLPNEGPPRLPENLPAVFGYNAVRVPLYLDWAGEKDASLYQPFIDWATHVSNVYQLPDQVNLLTNDPGEYTVMAGMIAIYHLIAPKKIPDPGPPSRRFSAYYSACLRLLTDLAAKESRTYSSLPRP